MKKAAIYVRVSTDKQTVENQLRELRQMQSAAAGKSCANITMPAFPARKAGKRGLALMKCSRTLNCGGLTWSWPGRLIGSVAR